MIQLDYAIQDVHGMTHPSAVIVIGNMNHFSQVSLSSSVSFDRTTGLSARSFNETPSHSLQFNAFMWHDMAAFEAKKQPMMLKDSNSMEWFTTQKPIAAVDAAAMEAECESFLRDVVLPAMKVNN